VPRLLLLLLLYADTPQLAEQRKRGVLTNKQIQRVAAELPGWRWDSRVRAPPLDKVLLLLVQFHAAHGRLPRQTEVRARRGTPQLPAFVTIHTNCAC
jgi:hypothetical protein